MIISNAFSPNHLSGNTVGLKLKLHVRTVWWEADATTFARVRQNELPKLH